MNRQRRFLAIVTSLALCGCIKSLGQLPPLELEKLPPAYGVYALDQGELTPLSQDFYGKTPDEQKKLQGFFGGVSFVVFEKMLGKPGPEMEPISICDWRTMDDKPRPKIALAIRPVKDHPEMTMVSVPGGLNPGLYSFEIGKSEYLFGVETDDPEDYWKAVHKEDTNRWHPYAYLGTFCYRRGDFDGALKYWGRGLELKPGLAETQNNYGLALMAVGRMDEALKHYKIATELDGSTPVRFNYADGLRIAKRYEEALVQYKKLSSMNPEDAAIYLDMGVTYFQMGKYDESVDSFKKAILLKPDYVAAQNDLKQAEKRRNEVMKNRDSSGNESK